MTLVDDPDVISVVRRLAAELGCSEEEAIGRAVAAEMLQRGKELTRSDVRSLEAAKPSLSGADRQ